MLQHEATFKVLHEENERKAHLVDNIVIPLSKAFGECEKYIKENEEYDAQALITNVGLTNSITVWKKSD